jgi:hypothetical protein
MSKKHPENPPAFPQYLLSTDYENKGLSLRDYFAAKAMQAFLTDGSESHIADKAERAYLMADYMLKAREEVRNV